MAKTIAEVLEVVKAASGQTDSLIAFSDAKKAEVEELLKNQMTPELQAGLDEIFDIETADATKIAAAMNTPPTP